MNDPQPTPSSGSKLPTALWATFALIAGLLHVLFFLLESVWFMDPEVYTRFKIPDQATAELLRVGMFNQGAYNLLLALGCLGGTGLALFGCTKLARDGRVLVTYTCLFMVGAAVALYLSKPELLRAVGVQGLPPALALLGLALSARSNRTATDTP